MSRPAPQLPTPAAIDFGAPSAERDIERWTGRVFRGIRGLQQGAVGREAHRGRESRDRQECHFPGPGRRERDEGSYVMVSRRKVHLKKGEASRIYKYIRDHHANDNASKLPALAAYDDQECWNCLFAAAPGLLSMIETFRGQPRVIARDDLELLALGLITREIPVRRLNLATAQHFQVHPIFRAYLGQGRAGY